MMPDILPCHRAVGPDSDSELFVAVSRAAKHLIRDRNWRDGVGDFLDELGRHTSTSRVWLFQTLEAGPDYYVTDFIYEWAARPDVSNIEDLRFRHSRVSINDEEARRLYAARLAGQVQQHHRSEVTGFLLREFEYQNIHSMLTIPIMVQGKWWGILGFDDCDGPRRYPASFIAALEIAAVLLTNAILRERLEWEVDHDYLTGLYNRRALIGLIERDLARVPDHGSLTVIDIDWFKRVNDAHGHQVGDQVLRGFADRVTAVLPDHACLARFGGEEFALWLPEGGPQAKRWAERLRDELRGEPIAAGDRRIPLSASFGIAEMRPAGRAAASAAELFEYVFARADDALFRAKSEGRNRIVCAF